MNFSELRDAVRVEAQLKDPESYTSTLNRLINSEFRKYTGKNRYSALLVSPSILSFLGEPTDGRLELPIDFQHTASLTWNDRSINILGYPKNPSRSRRIFSVIDPRYAQVVGQQLLLFPTENLLAADVINFGYYRFYLLQNDTDEHPVTALEDTVILAVAARILFLESSDRFKAAKGLERESFASVRSEFAGR